MCIYIYKETSRDCVILDLTDTGRCYNHAKLTEKLINTCSPKDFLHERLIR